MTKLLRWGLLSTANINKALLGPLRQSPRSELMAVASRDADRAVAYAAQHAIPKAYGSYEELLADSEVDAIYLSLPNGLHAAWAIQAMQAGKHVLCEKPLVVNMAEFEAVAAAARVSGVTIFEAFMYLHHPQTRQALELVRSGRLGRLQLINSWFNFYLPPERAANVRLRADLTGGAAWDVGVYPNSVAITMLGEGAPVEVWAQQTIGESGVDVSMSAQLRFASGAVAQISTGFRTPFREAVYLVGERGILHIPEPWKPGLTGRDSVMTLTDLDERTEQIITPAVNPYLCEVQAMEACVLDGAAPVVSLADSRTFLQSMLAIHQSARTGQVVRVGE
ncbi:MAG TPA: gfo/Idh/MocA family oxidoreductase [Chloroflexi bacterium]|nr:gfo/Idh/MocA family oxidoreductase [Chloroflexota bacterium]HHW86223.1 Gfo/Idh/MocA family oxidoreductase [Chloroflexota bacterium]